MFKMLVKAALIVVAMIAFAISPAFAAGTNVSSGVSFTVGHSHTDVKEWSNYHSQGHGVAISYDHNENGYDFRKEVYKTETRAGSRGKGTISGEFSSIDYTATAGMLRSSTGVAKGSSQAKMKSKAWGETKVKGRYVQISVQDDAHNYERGNFQANSGYNTESYVASMTAYVSTYSSTEFDY